ncbi:hypothetical protein [Thermobrachium celere]|uniref:hypothetical protein n=1 Tax=Thermobrachium celere TaxID=53422 RepID=UPI001942B262|nr:hypothetical protein [Thermobrachium celere]GFR35262.1 hypothetical protein TCEA9_10740 [Thermobrachium celere]
MRTQTYNLLGGIGLLIFSLSMLSHASQNFFSLWFHKNFNKKEKNKFMSLIQGIIFSFITESSTISATAYSGLLESNSIDFTNILYFISGVNIGASLVPIIVLLKFSIIPYLFVFLGTFLIIFINKSTKKKYLSPWVYYFSCWTTSNLNYIYRKWNLSKQPFTSNK